MPRIRGGMRATRFMALALLALMLVLPATTGQGADEEPPVEDLSHSPWSPAADASFDVVIVFEDGFEVNETEVQICSLTKETCVAPVTAETTDDKTYRVTIDIDTDPDERLGFKFHVESSNGTEYKYPTADTEEPGYEIDTLGSDYYFVVDIKAAPSEDEDDSPALGLPAMVGATLLVALARRRR